MSCPSCCCPWCKETEDEETKHKDVSYHKVRTIDMVIPEYEKVPLDKVFEFKQPQCPMPVHPQLIDQFIVTQQPTSSSSSSFTCDAEEDVDDDGEPKIHFSLYYDIQRCALTVHLMSGTNLPAKDRSGTSDPFVILFLVPNKEQIFESKIHKKTLEPYFNEVFEFTGLLPNEIRRQTLVLRVLDKDAFSSSDDMGAVVLPLEEADLYGVKVSAKLVAYTKSDTRGDILMSLMFNPTLNIISGIILKATNLQKMDISGSADPYVKIYLYYKGNREAKWKTSIKKKTLVPIYNENFQFDVTDMDIHFVRLELHVMDHDLLGRNDLMGIVQLGEGSDHPTGRVHWLEMFSTPRHPVSRWHTLEMPSSSGTLKRLKSGGK